MSNRSENAAGVSFALEEEVGELVAGCDEAGRGALCGPVFAAAVVFPRGVALDALPGLDDSKKLTPAKREALFPRIAALALSYAIAYASPEEIDRLNILEASQIAMRRAVAALRPAPELALVDGNIARGFPLPARAVVHGDARCASIAAASVLAKVARDREMLRLDALYPGYDLSRHKGYPTRAHYAALRERGVCEIYRKTFLRKMNEEGAWDYL